MVESYRSKRSSTLFGFSMSDACLKRSVDSRSDLKVAELKFLKERRSTDWRIIGGSWCEMLKWMMEWSDMDGRATFMLITTSLSSERVMTTSSVWPCICVGTIICWVSSWVAMSLLKRLELQFFISSRWIFRSPRIMIWHKNFEIAARRFENSVKKSAFIPSEPHDKWQQRVSVDFWRWNKRRGIQR